MRFLLHLIGTLHVLSSITNCEGKYDIQALVEKVPTKGPLTEQELIDAELKPRVITETFTTEDIEQPWVPIITREFCEK